MARTIDHTTIPLNPVTWGWQQRWDKLMRDDWLRRKVDRCRRIPELVEFAARWTRLMDNVTRQASPPWFLDLGPGPGELMEIARQRGWQTLGVDAEHGEGGMGDAYLEASKLMRERQCLRIRYRGVMAWMHRPMEPVERRFTQIVSRGSIEQIFSAHLAGPPHHEHQNCNLLSWINDDDTVGTMRWFFERAFAMTVPGGEFHIHANGAANTGVYAMLMMSAANRAGWMVEQHSVRQHTLIKPT